MRRHETRTEPHIGERLKQWHVQPPIFSVFSCHTIDALHPRTRATQSPCTLCCWPGILAWMSIERERQGDPLARRPVSTARSQQHDKLRMKDGGRAAQPRARRGHVADTHNHTSDHSRSTRYRPCHALPPRGPGCPSHVFGGVCPSWARAARAVSGVRQVENRRYDASQIPGATGSW